MGKRGREIVGIDVQDLVEDLQRAYADEWLAHYNYLLASHLASGLSSPIIAESLSKRSQEELVHANKLAKRILELGGEPFRNLGDLPGKSNCLPFTMPEDTSDLKGILQAVLQTERCAIDVYLKLVEKTRQHDPITHELVEELLADEVADEEDTENLLA